MRNKVLEYRKKIDLSQEKLSKAIGISRTYLSHIENGKVNPSVKIACKIAEALGEKVEDIFFDDNVNFSVLKRRENSNE